MFKRFIKWLSRRYLTSSELTDVLMDHKELNTVAVVSTLYRIIDRKLYIASPDLSKTIFLKVLDMNSRRGNFDTYIEYIHDVLPKMLTWDVLSCVENDKVVAVPILYTKIKK